MERAAKDFDGWVASAFYRTADQVIDSLGRYRAAGGQRAMVSTIQLTADHDLGQTRTILQRFAQAGFDDAIVSYSVRAARARLKSEPSLTKMSD